MAAGPTGADGIARLARLGLPAPLRAEPFGRPGRHRRTRLVLPEGARHREWLWVEVAASPPWDSLATEQVALTLVLQESDDGAVPVVTEYHLLPEPQVPAALHPLPEGVGADELVARTPAALPPVLRALGGLLARWPRAAWPRAASHAVPGLGFLPTRADDREELHARAASADWCARRAATDLGAVSEALLARVAAAPAPIPGGARLVHGALSPGALRVVPDGAGVRVTGVLDWGSARLGDPLADWAVPWMLGPAALREVALGFGLDEARDLLLAEGATERLAAQVAALVLDRLATLGELGGGDPEGLARVAIRVQSLGDEVRRALDAAPGPGPSLGRGCAALRRLGAVPAIVPSQAGVLVTALALDAQGDPRAAAVVDALGPTRAALPALPVPDRGARLAALGARGRARWEAVALTWLTREGLADRSGAVTDAAIHGLTALVEGLLRRPAEPRGSEALASAILSFAAGHGDRTAVRDAWEAVAQVPPTGAGLDGPPELPVDDEGARRFVVWWALGRCWPAAVDGLGARDLLAAC